ncbi:CYTH and CHAD domain-containing protein [Streptomyces physcomitrii]|uniref:CYTH and CHAD domain-containing protein n=1 Tax=Streptomyces physcomitrii TaxID=2724184 RepID=UPI0033D29DA3
MAHSKREIERKYQGPPGSGSLSLPELGGTGPVHAVRDKGVRELDALYFDTADARLAAGGLTLRRRTGGEDEGWHLKLPLAADVREEIQAPLAPEVPAELAALVRGFTRGAALVPLVRLVSVRELHHLVDARGTLLAEASVDRVLAERLGGASAEWTEAEVELAEGAPPALLDKLDKRLRKAGLRRAASPSKLATALARTAPERTAPEPPGTPAAEPPGRAGARLLGYLRAQRETLVHLDPAVRRELPDSVHRMRVATRRLRSALRSYADLLDREATEPLGAELKWLAGELGADRDLEVLTERLGAHLAELAPELVEGPVPQRLRQWAGENRGGSRGQVAAALDSERYLALLDRLDALLADPPFRKAAGGPPRKVYRKALGRELARLRRRLEQAAATAPGPERDLALHEARKKAKRTRYAAEAATELLGPPAKRLAKDVKKLQKLLGEHQDGVVARDRLRELAAAAETAGENAFTYGLLYGREERAAARCESEVPAAWQRVEHSGRRLRHKK